MAEYIDKEHLLTEYCSEDERTWDNGLWYIEHEPTANVVERDKIDKAIEEIEKQKKLIIEYEGESDLGIAIKIIKECLGEV